MKKLILRLIGLDAVVDFVVGAIAEGIGSLIGKFEADEIMYELGLRIRIMIPGDKVELHVAHLVKYFKFGLLGKELTFEEELHEEDDVIDELLGN